MEVRMEIGQTVEVTVSNFVDRRGAPAKIDPESVTWGIEPSGDFELDIKTPTGESSVVSVKHIGNSEVEATIRFQADGDTDPGEEQFVNINGIIIVDSPNAVSGEMTATDPHD